jgi:hypothetical protein
LIGRTLDSAFTAAEEVIDPIDGCAVIADREGSAVTAGWIAWLAFVI